MSGPHRERRLPLRPVLLFGPSTHVGLAATVGLHRQTIDRYLVEGIPESQADLIAVKLGVHPSAIWGDLWWKGADGP